MQISEGPAREALLANACDILREMLEWELAPARWDSAAQILEVLAGAVESDDLATMRQAVTDLELHGPVRITRIGATPTLPPPPPVRERVNHLVHKLSGSGR